MAIQPRWRFPFGVLLGQRSWFDSFATTFGPEHLAVEPPAAVRGAIQHRAGTRRIPRARNPWEMEPERRIELLTCSLAVVEPNC